MALFLESSLLKEDFQAMQEALFQAEKAKNMGEVPVGALVRVPPGDKVETRDPSRTFFRAHNLREINQNALDHAEVRAIYETQKKLGTWRLDGSTLYVTLEPCLMCLGALLQCRISRLVYGASDPKTGAFSAYKIHKQSLSSEVVKHKLKIASGLYEEESSKLLRFFFKKLRSS
jgi:tRNA(adenine34) deaminase